MQPIAPDVGGGKCAPGLESPEELAFWMSRLGGLARFFSWPFGLALLKLSFESKTAKGLRTD